MKMTKAVGFMMPLVGLIFFAIDNRLILSVVLLYKILLRNLT